MVFIKNNNRLIALLLIAFIFNAFSMEPIEQPILDRPSFADLPMEIQNEIILLLSTGATTQSVEEAGKAINAFAQTNKGFYQIINNPQICLAIIKMLSQQFKCSNQEAAEALQTQEAKFRLEIQEVFWNICVQEPFNEQEITIFYEKYKGDLDLNFTYHYHHDYSTVEILSGIYDNIGTLLMFAAQLNEYPLIQILLKLGADINKTTFDGETALIFAAQEENSGAIKCLLKYPNVNVNQQTNYGQTALTAAACNDECSIIHTLVEHGADINKVNSSGKSALTTAIACESEGVVECLLEYPNIVISQKDILEAQNTDPYLEIFNLIQDAIRKKYEKQGR